MEIRKNVSDLIRAIEAAGNPLNVANVIFNAEILKNAKNMFYSVEIFKLSVTGKYVKSDDNTGVMARIYRTDWEYAEEETFYNNADLEKFVNDELADRMWFYQHEMEYDENTARKYALTY